ncbi:MAG: hypothetical protein DCF15_20425 [Phormidesmis priestleyi]|uniref:Uncharacterized protein n=1 Tax=Phormidesmis priestleyi TaxID=268141 RepID=A0A2W4WT42_9CYAN|nr:MAG: hypothetical protein DCF15_20425 [Phormidesmis priestleyi]
MARLDCQPELTSDLSVFCNGSFIAIASYLSVYFAIIESDNISLFHIHAYQTIINKQATSIAAKNR